MSDVRVWELARWADLETSEVRDRLTALGVPTASALATISMAEAERFATALRAERTGERLEKLRVWELARQLGMNSAAVLELLDEVGIRATSHTSTIWEFDADRLRGFLEAPQNGHTHRDRLAPDATAGAPSSNGLAGTRLPPASHSDGSPTEQTAEADATAGPDAAHARTTDAAAEAEPGARPPGKDSGGVLGRGDLGLLLRIVYATRAHWRGILGMLALSLLSTPLLLLKPVPLKVAVDSVIGDQPLPGFLDAVVPDVLSATPLRLLVVAALLQVLIVAAIQLQGLADYVHITSTGERITLGFRARLFRHVQRLSLSFHDRRGTYESLYRIEYDAQSLQHTVDTIIPFVGSGVTLVVLLFVTFTIDAQLALIAIAVCPVLFWLSRRHIFQIRGGYRELRKLETSAMGVAQEVLASVRVVKAFGREDSEEQRFTRRYGASTRAKIQLATAEGSYGLWVNLTTAVGTALVLFVGMRNVLAGTTTLGELLIVIGYLAALYGPLKEIAQRVGDLQSALAGAERAFELLDEHPEVAEHPDARPVAHAEGLLEFRGVRFGYEPGRPVLDDINLQIDPGARVGLVGRTGAGKTTLVSLIMRFYDPDEGAVLLDGVDLRDYRLTDLRNQFALMLQEPVLFSTSIAENIRYARPDATEEDVEAAARAADAHDFVTSLPDGYVTPVGERGMLLSGGERQRISLARAFLRDAPILVLDEPTSSVDRATEGSILEAMERLMAGRTTLMIAHRLSTLDDCDGIIEISDGGVRVANSVATPRPRQATPA